MEDYLNILIIKVEGKGCSRCTLPSKELFFKVEGVKGVHVFGNKVAVIYNPKIISSKDIIEKSGVLKHYYVKVLMETSLPLNKVYSEAKELLLMM